MSLFHRSSRLRGFEFFVVVLADFVRQYSGFRVVIYFYYCIALLVLENVSSLHSVIWSAPPDMQAAMRIRLMGGGGGGGGGHYGAM